uniref:Uncharacterized protein n=1 Tax=Brassica oleracea var. oleracea TaxID=109376 RepID=A0A0D3DV89_BRAOL
MVLKGITDDERKLLDEFEDVEYDRKAVEVVLTGQKTMISSLQKLTDRPSDGMGSTGRESGRGWPISRGRIGAL